jgi:putative endonuclease
MEKWVLYMVQCADDSIYTGITNNLEARLQAHNAGKGAKYTKGRTPVVLKAVFEYADRSEASKAEYAFKKLTREGKRRVIFDYSKRVVSS